MKSAGSASDAVGSLATVDPEVHERLTGTLAALPSEKSFTTVNGAVVTGGTTLSVLTIVHPPSAIVAVQVPELL